MDAEQARGALLDERTRLQGLERFAADEQPEPTASQEGSVGQHPGDYGTEVETWMDDQGMITDARRQIRDIDAALERIDDGTWGTCEVCGRPIGDERLEARPQALRCVEHQEELERS